MHGRRLVVRFLLGGLQGGDGVVRLLAGLRELADLAFELIHPAAEAIDLFLRTLTRDGSRRRGDRLQLQAQSPIGARPGECQRGDGAGAEHDDGEHDKPPDDLASPHTCDSDRILAEFFVEYIELGHFRRLQ